jgi:hypothetical protein
MEGDVITMQDVFVLDHGPSDDVADPAVPAFARAEPAAGGPALVATGLRPAFLSQLTRGAGGLDPAVFTPPAGGHVLGRAGRRW